MTSFVISLNRFICIKCPTKYKILFSYDNVKIIIILIFSICLAIGFVCGLYGSQFQYDEEYKILYSLHMATGIKLCFRILYNLIMILMVLTSLIFNIIDALRNLKFISNVTNNSKLSVLSFNLLYVIGDVSYRYST
uniref:G_PROTEIN_RECEP_F1_2 domain-containing protein n=1 Tax=Strongyloides papillosus TaxID=174720 RepID=A0A0N5BXJ0_STREA